MQWKDFTVQSVELSVLGVVGLAGIQQIAIQYNGATLKNPPSPQRHKCKTCGSVRIFNMAGIDYALKCMCGGLYDYRFSGGGASYWPCSYCGTSGNRIYKWPHSCGTCHESGFGACSHSLNIGPHKYCSHNNNGVEHDQLEEFGRNVNIQKNKI